MRQRLKVFASFALYWICFHVIIRGLFLAYNHDLSAQLTTREMLATFGYGLRMDLSMSGYFLMFTGLMLTLSVFTQSRWLAVAINCFSIALLVMSSIIVMVDVELYRHWGFRLDTTPLFYISGAGSEAAGSVAVSVVIKLVLLLIGLATISIFVYSIWLVPQLEKLEPAKKRKGVALLAITALLVIPIRGSFSVAPMNTGFVYFHKTKPFANHAAINVVWNFLYALQQSGTSKYPDDFLDHALAEKYFNEMHAADDSTVRVFSHARPNIILFILESFTSNVIEPLGGVKGVTPNLNALCEEGILFDNFYASGNRTDKGIVSILSGYPAQPQSSIVKFPSKSQKLPSLVQMVKKLGYETSFLYGGDANFANLKSYLTFSGFDYVTTGDDFPDEQNFSKWGVHDHIAFERALSECDTATAPFFKVILSLSSHEPFDVPMEPYIKGTDMESMFLNSCRYTDQSIGSFMSQAKAKDWWKNTVVIFVADHGYRYPHNYPVEKRERFKIPLLMTGGAVKMDSVIHTYGNQTDLANTILSQIGEPSAEFRFSRNLLTPAPRSFAAYVFNNGYGYVTPETYIVYDYTGKQFLHEEGVTEKTLNESKAYQQILFLDYNAK